MYESAYEFTSTDYKGAEFSLSENAGKVTIIHFTQLENPICIECEEFIRQQIIELQDLVSLEAPGIDVITVNIRKNSYSEDGWSMAQEWYGANITWHWVEEFEPYPISANYIQFWQLNGAFSNPSIVLVDQEMMVVGVYHVYCIGKGVVDGVRSAESLSEDAEAVLSGEWEIQSDDGFQHEGATMGGMFLLGVVTSFSPCSLALLMAIVSFVGASSARALGGAKGSPSVGVGLRIGVTFTIGTAAVFLVFGLFISYVGDFVQVSTVFFFVAGAILVVLGLNILFPIFTWLKLRFSSLGSRSRKPTCSLSSTQEQPLGRLHRLSVKSPDLAGVVLGILFSVGWAPCALSLTLPIMILLVTQDISIWTGGLMMLAFGLGHGAAIIPFCAATGEVRGVVGNKYMSLARGVQKAFAIAVVVLGFLFMARFFGFDLW
ncbi:MAG: urease accessory protein UreH domain-containing protein [Thermoplasmata archaeon]